MKKLALITVFSFFVAAYSYAQTENNDASTPANFQKISNTIQSAPQASPASNTIQKDANAAGQNAATQTEKGTDNNNVTGTTGSTATMKARPVTQETLHSATQNVSQQIAKPVPQQTPVKDAATPK